MEFDLTYQHRSGWRTGVLIEALYPLELLGLTLADTIALLDEKARAQHHYTASSVLCEVRRHSEFCDICGFPAQGARDRRMPGLQFCYICAAVLEAWDMTETGTAVLYLTENPYRVTNWTGALKCRVLTATASEGRGFYATRYERHDVRFIGPDGALWYGRQQGDNQVLRCRRVKG